jgi:hypothetical protein
MGRVLSKSVEKEKAPQIGKNFQEQRDEFRGATSRPLARGVYSLPTFPQAAQLARAHCFFNRVALRGALPSQSFSRP